MSETLVLSASEGSTGVLVASGIGFFLGTSTRMAIGYLSEGFKTLDLTSKRVNCLFGNSLSAVGAGTSVESGVDVVFFLKVIAD